MNNSVLDDSRIHEILTRKTLIKGTVGSFREKKFRKEKGSFCEKIFDFLSTLPQNEDWNCIDSWG